MLRNEVGNIFQVILQANERSSDVGTAAEKLKMLLHEVNLFSYVEIFSVPNNIPEIQVEEAVEEVRVFSALDLM